MKAHHRDSIEQELIISSGAHPRPCGDPKSTTKTALNRFLAMLGNFPGKLGMSRSAMVRLKPLYRFLSCHQLTASVSDFKLCLHNTQDSNIRISVCMVVRQLPMHAFACMNQPLGRRHAAKTTVNNVGWQQWAAPVEASR